MIGSLLCCWLMMACCALIRIVGLTADNRVIGHRLISGAPHCDSGFGLRFQLEFRMD